MGAIVHTVLNRVLSNITVKNIYGNINYAKMFLQGTVINVFDGRTPGGKNAVWKLTVDFEMHSEEPTLGVKLKSYRRFLVRRRRPVYARRFASGAIITQGLMAITEEFWKVV